MIDFNSWHEEGKVHEMPCQICGTTFSSQSTVGFCSEECWNELYSPPSVMSQSIDVLDITQRTKNDLKYCGLFTIGDLNKCKVWGANFFGMFLDDVKVIEEALSKISKEAEDDR